MSESVPCLLFRDAAGLIRAAVMADAPTLPAVECDAARSSWKRSEHDLEDARAIVRREGTWYGRVNPAPQPAQPALF